MEDLIVFLILGGLAIAAIFYLSWIALALIFRLLSLVLLYYAVGGTLALLSGVLLGLWIPWAVLSGRAQTQPRLLTPDDVVDGDIMGTKPRGPAEHFGWDRAWPTYIPRQAVQDGRAVYDEGLHWLTRAYSAARGGASFAAPAGFSVRGGLRSAAGFGPMAARVAFLLVPMCCFAVGLVVSIATWLVLMTLIGSLVYVGRQLVLYVLRAIDRHTLKRLGASTFCPSCKQLVEYPSYACSNTACTIVHRDLRPGALGVLARRCACGERLPTTIYRASKVLPVACPHCNYRLASGTGTRASFYIAMFGAIAAGKTRLIASAAAALEQSTGGGAVTAMSGESEAKLALFRGILSKGTNTVQTDSPVPSSLSLLVERSGERPVEMHLVDVAGERFWDWDRAPDLGYFEHAERLLFVLDPLSLAAVNGQFKRSRDGGTIPVSHQRAMDAYVAAVDPLRQRGVPLEKRRLGVVLTKGDVLVNLLAGLPLRDADSAGVRAWLLDKEDLLVARMERDFKDVHYFLVDSMSPLESDDPRHPLRAVEWVVAESKAGWPVRKEARAR